MYQINLNNINKLPYLTPQEADKKIKAYIKDVAELDQDAMATMSLNGDEEDLFKSEAYHKKKEAIYKKHFPHDEVIITFPFDYSQENQQRAVQRIAQLQNSLQWKSVLKVAYDACPYPLPIGIDVLNDNLDNLGVYLGINEHYALSKINYDSLVSQLKITRYIVEEMNKRFDDYQRQHTDEFLDRTTTAGFEKVLKPWKENRLQELLKEKDKGDD